MSIPQDPVLRSRSGTCRGVCPAFSRGGSAMSITSSPRMIGLGAGTLLLVGLQVATATSTQGSPLPEQCGTTTYAGFGDPLPAPLTINGNASVVATGDGSVLRVTP